MDLNTKRGWKCSSGRRGLGDYSAELCISARAGCSCRLSVTWTFLPFWADRVCIDLVADVLIGSSKVGQALIVAIRHWESKQKRGSDCKCSLFGGQDRLPRVACAPLPPPCRRCPNQLFLLKHTQDLMMVCVREVECYSVWQMFIKYWLCARSLVQQFKPQISHSVRGARGASVQKPPACPYCTLC